MMALSLLLIQLRSLLKRAEMVDDRSGRPDLESMKLAAQKLEKTVRETDGNISNVAIEICSDTHWRNVINSNGLDVESSMNLYSVRATVMAKKDATSTMPLSFRVYPI